MSTTSLSGCNDDKEEVKTPPLIFTVIYTVIHKKEIKEPTMYQIGDNIFVKEQYGPYTGVGLYSKRLEYWLQFSHICKITCDSDDSRLTTLPNDMIFVQPPSPTPCYWITHGYIWENDKCLGDAAECYYDSKPHSIDNNVPPNLIRYIPDKNSKYEQCSICGRCVPTFTLRSCKTCKIKACNLQCAIIDNTTIDDDDTNDNVSSWNCSPCLSQIITNKEKQQQPCLSLDCNITSHNH